MRRSAKPARGSAKKAAKTTKAARRSGAAAGKNARVARPNGKVAARKSVRVGSPAGKLARNTGSATIRAAKTPHIPSPTVQPLAAHEILLKTHKYQVGQTVYFTSPNFGRAAASGSYKVVKLLPSEGDDYHYRIKSSGEAFERVAKESQLENI